MKRLFQSLFALMLMLMLVVPFFADTIKLKDGSVIHGQVVGFKDGQFTVLIGSGAKGRRSRTMIYVEDIESIEFDASVGVAGASANDDQRNTDPVNQPYRPSPTPEPVYTNP